MYTLAVAMKITYLSPRLVWKFDSILVHVKKKGMGSNRSSGRLASCALGPVDCHEIDYVASSNRPRYSRCSHWSGAKRPQRLVPDPSNRCADNAGSLLASQSYSYRYFSVEIWQMSCVVSRLTDGYSKNSIKDDLPF